MQLHTKNNDLVYSTGRYYTNAIASDLYKYIEHTDQSTTQEFETASCHQRSIV